MADSSIGATCAQSKSKTSRRAILAGMALAPVAALPAVAAIPATSTAWMAAKARHATAGRAVSDYETAVLNPAWERFSEIKASVEDWRGLPDAERDRLDTSGYDEAWTQFDELVDERMEALRNMFATAAPDLDGVLHKLKWFQNEDAQDLVYAKDLIANLIEDVARLNGGAA